MRPISVASVVLIVAVHLVIYLLVDYVLRAPPLPVIEERCWGRSSRCDDNDTSVRPFNIHATQKILEDLRYRLANAIIPEPIENSKQHYGFNGNTLRNVTDYWLRHYNWAQRQIYLNRYPQFKTNVQGLDLHFIRVKREVPGGIPVLPILLLHGWCGSVREFYDVIPILASTSDKYGFAFEVVAPSLPGFIFSEATSKPGLGAANMAVVIKNLMLRLGHEQFYIHGGDWGSVIARDMATMFPDNVLGLHCTLAISTTRRSWAKFLLGALFPGLVVPEEHRHLMYPLGEKLYNFYAETGYYHIQATKPDTIGTALANSPVSLAAYLLEKFSTLTDRKYKDREDAGLLERYTYDKLIDNLMLYWISASITSATRIYYESHRDDQGDAELSEIPIDARVPCAVARFPNEVIYQSDYILRDKFVNLVQSTDFERGGHFAAMENGMAETFAMDIFSAVNKMRRSRERGET